MIWSFPQTPSPETRQDSAQFAASHFFSGELQTIYRADGEKNSAGITLLCAPCDSVSARCLPRSDQRLALRALSVMALHVTIQNLFELRHNRVAAQRHRKFSIDVNRRNRIFKCSRQTDAEVGVLRFTRPVHHASH